jgi:4-amino-4-deoxy-L-arabinose transferase-like glycosyltransferase
MLGIGESPGFTLDEIIVIDPALHLKRFGFLAFPSAGPGFGHESAYFYQLPLHAITLAGVFLLPGGDGLLQGRLFSAVLAAAVLLACWWALQPISRRVAILATLLLAIDPLFAARAREIRYDMIALLGLAIALGAFLRYIRESENPRPALLLVTGLALAIAVNSHLLFIIYLPAIGLALTIYNFRFRPRPLRTTALEGLWLSVPFAVALIPCTIYILTHYDAFLAQMGHQVATHRAVASEVNWLLAELAKFASYYKLTPLLLAAVVLSVVGLCAFLFIRRAGASASQLNDPCIIALSLITLFATVLLSVGSSGHRPWHHLIVAPLWVAMPALFIEISARSGYGRLTNVAAVVIAAAVLNGAVASWGLRTLAAVSKVGERDPRPFYGRLENIIPAGSSVYGDYRLIFLAHQQNWRFVHHSYVLLKDEQRLATTRFDYLVLSEFTGDHAGIPLASYTLVDSMRAQPSAWRALNPNPDVVPLRFDIYRRSD